jgi:hypothetical protein
MAFCGGRTPITKTNVDLDLPIIGGVGENNVMGCSSPQFQFVPKGVCGTLFDPDNMKICGVSAAGTIDVPFMDQYEACSAPTSVGADPTTDYCQVPDGLTGQNQLLDYGVNCEGKKPIPSCQGLGLYKRYNDSSRFNAWAPQWTEWDNQNRSNFTTTIPADPNEDSPEYQTRINELRNICNSSYSDGLRRGVNLAGFELTGENPWEYCEWSDVFDSCSTGGSSSTGRNSCSYQGRPPSGH